MATDLLVEDRIEDGRKLLTRLAGRGFDVTAACWVKRGEEGRWFLYIASRVVDEKGLAAAYREAYGEVLSLESPWVSMSEVKLVSPEHPLARDVLEIRRRYPGRTPTRTRRPELGNVAIEEAYVYPAPVGQRHATIPLGKRKLKTAVEQVSRTEEMLAPLSSEESRALEQMVASGISPAQAEYWVRKKRGDGRPPIPAGAVVNAEVLAWWGDTPEDDPNPLLRVEAPDGAQGLTFKDDTEAVDGG